MLYMLCHNKVRDYEVWRRIFDSHAEAHRKAGLELIHIWRSKDDPNTIFFLFKVADIERAEEFVNAPDNEAIAKEAGVLGGEIRYLEEVKAY